MARWGMVIDLRKCIGCNSCIEICKQVNNVPSSYKWRRLIDRTLEESGKLKRLFVTMGCMHCDNPPCLEVCPTKATYQTNEGIVDIDHDHCIGCGACVLACPYNARSINRHSRMSCYERRNSSGKEVEMQAQIGTCRKCNLCRDLIETGLKKGLRPGRDSEASPMCVRYCLGEALSFGDLDDPQSGVSQILSQNRTIRFLEDLGTNPAIYYIAEDKNE